MRLESSVWCKARYDPGNCSKNKIYLLLLHIICYICLGKILTRFQIKELKYATNFKLIEVETVIHLSRWWKNLLAYLLIGSLYSSTVVSKSGLVGA